MNENSVKQQPDDGWGKNPSVAEDVFRTIDEWESAVDEELDAVNEERERCARLVEQMALEAPGPNGPNITVLLDTKKIAARIRQG
jgi:hypothetical protein